MRMDPNGDQESNTKLFMYGPSYGGKESSTSFVCIDRHGDKESNPSFICMDPHEGKESKTSFVRMDPHMRVRSQIRPFYCMHGPSYAGKESNTSFSCMDPHVGVRNQILRMYKLFMVYYGPRHTLLLSLRLLAWVGCPSDPSLVEVVPCGPSWGYGIKLLPSTSFLWCTMAPGTPPC